MTGKFRLFGILWVSFLICACSEDKLSRENAIKQAINAGVEAAESRNIDDLAELIDDHYSDEKGLNKTRLIRLLRLYFLRHKKIYLFSKIEAIDFPVKDGALLKMRVAVAGSIISDESVLANLTTKIYKLELSLIKREKWLIRRAKWLHGGLGDLQ